MKRNILILIIFLISLALVGLVGIQVYWINNAIEVKETNFNQSVNEALANVIYKLEKFEIAEQIQQKEMFYRRGSDLFKSMDSLNYLYFYELETLHDPVHPAPPSVPEKGSVKVELPEEDRLIVVNEIFLNRETYYYDFFNNSVNEITRIIENTNEPGSGGNSGEGFNRTQSRHHSW